MQKILLVCDVILDLLSKRKPFYQAVADLFVLIEKQNVKAFVTPLLFTNVHYVLSKQFSKKISLNRLRKLKLLVKIMSVDEKTVEMALANNDFQDFEDAVHYYAALEHNIDFIITRNKKDFRNAKLPVMDAEEYLDQLNPKTSS